MHQESLFYTTLGVGALDLFCHGLVRHDIISFSQLQSIVNMLKLVCTDDSPTFNYCHHEDGKFSCNLWAGTMKRFWLFVDVEVVVCFHR